MAKPLVFDFQGAPLAFQMTKVDRSKLYGYKEMEVLDDDGRPCALATLANDGRTVAGRGGVALAYLSSDGAWCERGDLRPVDLEGRTIQPVPSSFAAPLPLATEASMEDYLEHNIRAIYLLACEGDATPLVEKLQAGAIYKFPYSFRGGLEADVGFLLAASDGHLFLAVGSPTTIEFVGLQQAAGIVDEEQAGDAEEGDLMDFDMI